LRRWCGEPVKALIIPTSIFITNQSGFPVLTKKHQVFIASLLQYKTQLVVKGRARHAAGMSVYTKYLQHLNSQRAPKTQQDAFEAPYLDFLQAPLQPLMDNLESQTYETFERDPVKYEQYYRATKAALDDTPPEQVTVLMVVGAGRGPLVKTSLRAAEDAKREVRVYAVEKNPNAVITLRNMHRSLGWGQV
jgi:protein arginine N-methyltransferase 5